MTNIPIHYTDEIIEEAVKEIWQWKPPKTEPIKNDKEERVISYTADIKTYAIAILSILLIAILIGYYMKDGRISAEYDNIKDQNKNIVVQTRIMNNSITSIEKSKASKEASYKKIKSIINEK